MSKTVSQQLTNRNYIVKTRKKNKKKNNKFNLQKKRYQNVPENLKWSVI